MSIRFDNATERLSRTTGLPSFDANYTVMAWIYITTHNGTGNGACVISIDDQTNDVDEFYIAAPGASTLALGIVTLGNGDPQGSTGSTTFSAGTWQHVCIVRSANDTRTGYRNGVSEVTHSVSRSGRTAPTSMSMGSVLDDDLLNGRMAAIKIWTAALTVGEIQQEMYTIRPQRTADLHLWTPGFAHTDINDYSGNGRNWTASGTLSDEDGPPVSWGAPIWVVPWVASAGGTLSVNVSDTVTLSETVTISPFTRAGSASDTITLSESVTVDVQAATPATLSVSASDSVTLSETITARLAAALSVSRSESVTLSESVLVQKLVGACIGGVLRQNTANGRYLENDSGIVFLAGFHTWYNLFNGGASDPPPAFTWNTYTASLIAKGATHVRGWIPETVRHWPSDNTQIFEMLPWARTGPGNAADGHPKFDLSTFNDDFFARLRARCVELGNAGIYVTVVLFNGFHIDNTKPGGGAGDPWAYHPFEDGNNINSLDGDTDNDGVGAEIRATTFTAAYNFQKAYVEKVIDTLNDLDNILFEISNEDGTYAETWQKALVDYIHAYESGKAKQHPVGMTKLYPSGTNSMLTSSNADWISPDEDLTPVAQNSTAQAWMYDTDHTVGDTTDYKWTWIAALQGYGGAWYMDPWDSTSTGDTISNPTYEKIRNNLGYVVDYVSRIDLENATPQGTLSDTGYVLAKTTGAPHQYLVYQSATGNITLDVSATSGVLTVEWLRTSNGATGGATTVNGGASRTLTNPWASEDAVVYLWQSTYARSVSDSVTTSESVTVSVQAQGSLAVSVSDAVTVAETIAAVMAAALRANVTDSATISEAVSLALAALRSSVTDAATVTETVSAVLATLQATATDTATLSESTGVTLPLAGVYYVSVTDSATVTESSTATPALAGVSITDTTTLTEAVTVVAFAAGTLQISAVEVLTLSDVPALGMALPGVTVNDALTLSEAAAAAIGVIAPLGVAASESVSIIETTEAAMLLPGVSVVDSVTVADVIVAYMTGVAHADWALRDAAVWGWTMTDRVNHSWTLSDRSQS